MSRNSAYRRDLKVICCGLLAALILAFPAKTTLADEGTPIKGTFTAAFVFITSSNACGGGDSACIACTSPPSSGSFIEAQGIGNTSGLGTLFFEVRKCLDSTFTNYSGVFTLTAPNGKDSLLGTYTATNGAADVEGFQPFTGKLTITGGTGRFLDARGSARFTAVGSPNNMAFYSVDGNLESTNE